MQAMSYQTPQQKADMEFKQFVKQTQYKDGDISSSDPEIRNRGIKAGIAEFMDQYKGLVKSTS